MFHSVLLSKGHRMELRRRRSARSPSRQRVLAITISVLLLVVAWSAWPCGITSSLTVRAAGVQMVLGHGVTQHLPMPDERFYREN